MHVSDAGSAMKNPKLNVIVNVAVIDIRRIVRVVSDARFGQTSERVRRLSDSGWHRLNRRRHNLSDTRAIRIGGNTPIAKLRRRTEPRSRRRQRISGRGGKRRLRRKCTSVGAVGAWGGSARQRELGIIRDRFRLAARYRRTALQDQEVANYEVFGEGRANSGDGRTAV